MRIVLAIIAMVMTISGVASACSCYWKYKTAKSHADETYAIFKGDYVGELQRPEGGGPDDGFGKFRVIEVLKGPRSDFISLRYTKDNSMNCGLIFEQGGVYEVFAFASNGVLLASECEGTRKSASRTGKWSWENYRKVVKSDHRR
ncbi:MAG: hypothetical protein K2Q06_16900 [Parvularculaceae bacterium]|nr:hypothetical protein [Parvularculaceae bacterium]